MIALRQANLVPTTGDSRCLLFGHLIRLVIWQLRPTWNKDEPVATRLARVKAALQQIYPVDLLDQLATEVASTLSDIDKTLDQLVENTNLSQFSSVP